MKKFLLLLTALLSAHAMQAADPLVKEGKIWYYDHVTIDEDTHAQNREFRSAWTLRESIEQNGHTYYNLRAIGVDVDHHQYMRQEGDKVYMLLNSADHPDDFISETGGEILLYDFSLKEGEFFDSFYIEGIPRQDMPVRMTVISTETMTVNGVERRGQCFDLYFKEYDGSLGRRWKSIYIVEGIGPQTEFVATPFEADIYNRYEEPGWTELSKVCDGDVEVFNHTDFDRYFTGVEEVSDSGGVKDGKMYDIMGREVKNPQPGSVYIQNGRKFVKR